MTPHSIAIHDAFMERRFRIDVRGSLGPDFQLAFGEVEVREAAGTSELSGRMVDPALLDGILSYLRDLGIELISVDTWETPDRGVATAPEEGERR